MPSLTTILSAVLMLCCSISNADELPRLPSGDGPIAEKKLPYLTSPYLSLSPDDLNDGLAVGELTLPGVEKAVAAFVAADKEDAFGNLDSLLVWHDGKLLFEYYNRRGRVDGPHYGMSTTKTMTSVTLARAIQLGVLSMDDLDKPVLDFLPEIDRSGIQSGVDSITIRDALMMKSGLRDSEDSSLGPMPNDLTRQAYYQEYFKRVQPITLEGKTYKYGGGDPALVLLVLDTILKGSVQDFIKNEVMKPVGGTYNWGDQSNGIPKGGAGSSLTSRTFLKFTVAVQQGGVWKGEQFLDADYIGEVLDTEKGAGYFYYFHNRDNIGDDGEIDFISGVGAGGQHMAIMPHHGVAIVTTAHGPGVRKPLGAIYSHFMPLFSEL